MNTPVVADHLLSHDEYFAIEEEDDHRYEYVAGKIFAMTGGTERQALISANTLIVIANVLRDTACRVYGADMKLFIENRDKFCYPDVMVLWEQGVRHDLYVENPLLMLKAGSHSGRQFLPIPLRLNFFNTAMQPILPSGAILPVPTACSLITANKWRDAESISSNSSSGGIFCSSMKTFFLMS